MGFPRVAQVVKSLPANVGDAGEGGSISEEEMTFLPRESHGRRSLAGYSSQDCKESDMAVIEHTY